MGLDSIINDGHDEVADGTSIYAVTISDVEYAYLRDTIVEFDGTTGRIRAEYTRPNEDITQIQWLP